MTQDAFALLLGLKPSKIRDIEAGRQRINDQFISRLVEHIHVDLNWLFSSDDGEDGSQYVHAVIGNSELIAAPQSEGYVSNEEELGRVRLHDVQASAGAGQLARDGQILSEIGFPMSWLSRHGISATRATLIYVDGDSMEPTIAHGSMVLVDHNRTSLRRKRVYAFREGDALFVKRLERVGDQIIVLSDNPEHEARLISGADLEQVTILGEVVWSGKDWS